MTARAFKSIGLTTAALVLVVALGLASAQAAGRRTVRIPSHIRIAGNGLRFHGRVTSPNHACVESRTVTLYRTNGDVLGTTHTNNRGRWHIEAEGSAGISQGHFYAIVKRESQGTAGTIYVCKAARSRTIPFHQ